jgi:hypothetical protein
MRLLSAALAAVAFVAVPAVAVTAYNHTSADRGQKYNADLVVEGHGHLIGSARNPSIRSEWQQAGLPH